MNVASELTCHHTSVIDLGDAYHSDPPLPPREASANSIFENKLNISACAAILASSDAVTLVSS
jgi:hypothetical protein